MSIDESKPPKGWHWYVFSDGTTNDWHVSRETADTEHGIGLPLVMAHRIAREEAAPYVAEALAEQLRNLASEFFHERTFEALLLSDMPSVAIADELYRRANALAKESP